MFAPHLKMQHESNDGKDNDENYVGLVQLFSKTESYACILWYLS